MDTGSNYLNEELLRHPILDQLSELAEKLLGIGFVVIHPQPNGWGHIFLSRGHMRPELCKLVQSTPEGAKHCRMCHILMSVAACNAGVREQRCHSGASVLVTPIHKEEHEGLAILSTCAFIKEDTEDVWHDIESRGRKLGVEIGALKLACEKLPDLDPEKVALARTLMALAAEVVKELLDRYAIEMRLKEIDKRGDRSNLVQDVVEKELHDFMPTLRAAGTTKKAKGKKRVPVLIEVVSDLVTRRPNLPYSVAAIAAAAHMTPNHFSTLFHSHKHECFSDFLTSQRIELAKQLLTDLTLNITEVSLRAGYDDPGYFARRFKQRTGVSPREWRESRPCRKSLSETGRRKAS